LRGIHASNTLDVVGGSVALACGASEVATVPTIKATNAAIRIGLGVTWTTFEQSAEFFEACEGVTDTRARGQALGPIIRFVVGLILVAIVIALRIAAH
jgi:hypothetical protein